MLPWFEDLEPGEVCSACAIVDDKAFVRFYLALVREERKQQESAQGHALFAKEFLQNVYRASKTCSSTTAAMEREKVAQLSRYSGLQSEYDNIKSLLTFLNADSKLLGEESNDPFSFRIRRALTLQSGDQSKNRCSHSTGECRQKDRGNE
jgi:hypothetical protein